MLLCHMHAILSLKKFQFFFPTTPHKFGIFFLVYYMVIVNFVHFYLIYPIL